MRIVDTLMRLKKLYLRSEHHDISILGSKEMNTESLLSLKFVFLIITILITDSKNMKFETR